jgi:hypothetical protein
VGPYGTKEAAEMGLVNDFVSVHKERDVFCSTLTFSSDVIFVIILSPFFASFLCLCQFPSFFDRWTRAWERGEGDKER